MGRFFGSLLIATALVCLVFFIALEAKDRDDTQDDRYDLGPRNSNDASRGYSTFLERDSDLQLNFDSNGGVRVVHRDQRTGNENVVEHNGTNGFYEFYTEDDGDHEIRFENQESTRTEVHFTITTTTKDDEGPRLLCGILTPIFLILGIIFMKRKSEKKGPAIIRASHLGRPQIRPMFPRHSHPGHPQPPQEPRPEFSPPADHPASSDVGSATQATPPSPTQPQQMPPPRHHVPNIAASEADISTDSAAEQPFPMPSMADRISHEFTFECPDCGTVIFINRKIKKVTCPKCSHSFKIKQV